MIDRRVFSHINWGLLGLVVLLFLIGAVNLYSASTLRGAAGLELDSYFNKQMLWGGASFCVMMLCVTVDYWHFRGTAWPLFHSFAVPAAGRGRGRQNHLRRQTLAGSRFFQPATHGTGQDSCAC